jgi:acetyl-CoA hydrolase
MLASETFANAHSKSIRLLGYGGIGTARTLIQTGGMDVLPHHYSQLARLVEMGELRCDVVLLQLSSADLQGRNSFGIAHDYLAILARRARVVIAEINDQMPWTFGSAEALEQIKLSAAVYTSRPIPMVSPAKVGDIERLIAMHAAQYIDDRSVIQPGVGSVPDAILDVLSDRRDLGVHAGLIGDGVRRLIECGAVTNAFKEVDKGMTTTGLAFGSEALYSLVTKNRSVVFRDPSVTHAQVILCQLSRFIALNSAVEVDLTGQVNAEIAAGSYVGAVGGQVDFLRAAQMSLGGRSIIALPSTNRRGQSRIVASLSAGTVTTPRSDVDLVVTEWGVAQLRGQPLRERARRLIAISAPEHRESLERASFLCTL